MSSQQLARLRSRRAHYQTSVDWGIADQICSMRAFPLVTHLGRQLCVATIETCWICASGEEDSGPHNQREHNVAVHPERQVLPETYSPACRSPQFRPGLDHCLHRPQRRTVGMEYAVGHRQHADATTANNQNRGSLGGWPHLDIPAAGTEIPRRRAGSRERRGGEHQPVGSARQPMLATTSCGNPCRAICRLARRFIRRKAAKSSTDRASSTVSKSPVQASERKRVVSADRRDLRQADRAAERLAAAIRPPAH
jgi:hypothetical protein